ncbi:MAG: hypothetical protein P8181_15590, partial [bacterium]
MGERKRSLGRDVFEKAQDDNPSGTIKNILEGKRFKEPAAAREVDAHIKLTPSNIKHLDAIRRELEKKGKGRFSR